MIPVASLIALGLSERPQERDPASNAVKKLRRENELLRESLRLAYELAHERVLILKELREQRDAELDEMREATKPEQ